MKKTPLLIPGLTGAIRGTLACLPDAREAVLPSIQLLVGYGGLLITVAFFVFKELWEE
jgi:hypothetical protein